MTKVLMVIPIITFFANIAILLDIPIFREIIVFVFLSFIPGFSILRLFRLKEINFLETVLFSIALSIAFAMFMSLLVNELYLFLGFSQSLSTVPLTVAISAFTLIAFFVEYRRNLPATLELKRDFGGKQKDVIPLSIVLFLLPLLNALGVLYLDVFVILLSDAIIAFLCLMSVVSRRVVPESLFPFLILSISVVLVCQVLLTSKYPLGYDVKYEYYVFRLTQIKGHWSFPLANVNPVVTQNYNMMLSITLLPAVYSALMHAQGEIVFKILYPFIFLLIPLILYRICEKQFGKLTGLLSALFFVFTSTAFYGLEPLSLSRQIVAELFLLFSVFLLISNTIPVTKRRLLLIIFGAALALSHYSVTYIYLGMVTLVFIISIIKPRLDITRVMISIKLRFDNALNAITVLLLFVLTFSWYALGPGSPLISLTNTLNLTFAELTGGWLASGQVTSDYIFFAPKVFTVATWINLLLSSIANLFLMLGALAIILRPKGTGILPQYYLIIVIAAMVLFASLVAPSFASTINFTRFYAITLLFLSPCFVLGGQALLAIIGKAWTKIRRSSERQIASESKNVDRVFFLIAIILSGYFLSQVGFVNYVTNSPIHCYSTDFQRMLMSNESQIQISLYSVYTPEQDLFSASWLFNHKAENAGVYHDTISSVHALVSYGLIPIYLLRPITNATIPLQGSFVYLGTLNIVDGIITTGPFRSFNTSDYTKLVLDQNNLVYSNGNSIIWYATPAH